jgi:hypothetical protein
MAFTDGVILMPSRLQEALMEADRQVEHEGRVWQTVPTCWS